MIGQVITALTGFPWRVGGVKREPLAIRFASGMSAECVDEDTDRNWLFPDGRIVTRTTTRPLVAFPMLRGNVTEGFLRSRGFLSSSPIEYWDFGLGGACLIVGRTGFLIVGLTTGRGLGLETTGSGAGG